MKKTKKILSSMLLMMPLALPAGCSPVSTAGVQGTDGQKKAQSDDEAKQLRLIVERYFEQQEQQAVQPVDTIRQLQTATPQQQPLEPVAFETEDDAEPGPALVGSEEELKEELEELKKTGDWKAENVDGSKSVQCLLPPVRTAVIEGPDRPAVPQLDKPLPQPAETAAVPTSKSKRGQAGVKCFPVVVNRQVQFYLNLFQGKQRKHFNRWLERSSLYIPLITAELEKAGLPLELGYLAMIESGFNPSAYSPSQAAGLWQFIPSTGRTFGLRVDSAVDERRDPEKSTKAAVAYLKTLYRQFGDWHLAVAAYNAGEGAVERGLKRYKIKNFWELAQQDYLRLETKRYVPQMIAAAMIASNHEQYGFSGLRRLRPVQHELVRVPSGASLKAVAASASMSVEQLRSLNNDLLQDQVPTGGGKGGWLLKVPVGRSALVAANLPKAVQVASARSAAVSSSEYVSHKVAKDETLQQISKQYGISMTTLLKVNSLRSSQLKTGQMLRVPLSSSGTEQLALVKNSTQPALAAADKTAAAENITHKLKKGETLSWVADKYNVSLIALMKWNSIDKASKVKAGQELTVHTEQKNAQVAAVEPAAEAESDVLADIGIVELTAVSIKQKPSQDAVRPHQAESEKKFGAVVELSGGKKQKAGKSKEDAVSYYKVRSGDSLWSISKKLQVSAKEIKDWNSLGDQAIRPGLTLVIKNG